MEKLSKAKPARLPSEVAHPIYTLSQGEATALAEAGRSFSTFDPNQETEMYCRAARRAGRHLPDTLLDILQQFNDDGSSKGILVIRGSDVGGVPATPPDNTYACGCDTELARQSAVMAEVIGHLVKYQAEAGGSLQQDMVPNRAKQFTQESQGSRVILEAHTEQCFSHLRPDFVILACLRGDPAAATYTFTARQLIGHLTQAEVMLLRRRLWTTKIDSSFHPYVPVPDDVRGPLPIIGGSIEDPTLLIDQDLMHGITAEAQALLQKVIAIYEENRNSHVLQRGDILLLDNRRAMHGRSAFQPQFDGGDRFIVRSMAVRDLHRLDGGRDGRLVLAKSS